MDIDGDVPQQVQQVAIDMQTMITHFVVHGHPQIESFGGMKLPTYSRPGDRATLVFNATRSYTLESDPWKSARCDWWQKGLFVD
jgi:carboxylesterase type B